MNGMYWNTVHQIIIGTFELFMRFTEIIKKMGFSIEIVCEYRISYVMFYKYYWTKLWNQNNIFWKEDGIYGILYMRTIVNNESYSPFSDLNQLSVETELRLKQ